MRKIDWIGWACWIAGAGVVALMIAEAFAG
jgi:hypothetical protein